MDVTALTCNRSHLDEGARYPGEKPGTASRFTGSSGPPGRKNIPVPRLGNSAWLLSAWFLRTLELGRVRRDRHRLRSFVRGVAGHPTARSRPRTPIIHWCLDVFPDAGEAEWTGATRLLSRPARALMSAAYRRCDVVVDLGPCMRRRLERYGGAPRARR